jgi:hypothetical protein
MRAVTAGQRLARPRHDTPEDIVALLRDCTQLVVAQRPSMDVALKRLSTKALFVTHLAAEPVRECLSLIGEAGKEMHTETSL